MPAFLRWCASLLVLAPATSLAQRIEVPAALARAVERAGGEAALRSIGATRTDVHVSQFLLGQEQHPEGLPPVGLVTGEVLHDFVGARRAVRGTQWHRAHRFPTRIVVTPTGALEESWGLGPRAPSGDVERRERHALRFAPERVLVTALDARCRSRPLDAWDRRHRLPGVAPQAVSCAGGDTTADAWVLYFDDLTGALLARATTAGAGRSAVVTLTRYDDHRPVDGARARVIVPHLVQTEVDGRLATIEQRGRVHALRAVDDSVFAIPERIVAGPAAPVTVRLQELAPGVHHVRSGAYLSLAVVQGDSIVLADAPDDAVRTTAMLDTLRARFPGAPVRLVVNSHHHADHAGGIPAALARGIPVMTHEVNRAAILRLRAGVTGAGHAAVIAVRDSTVIGEGTDRLVAYAVWNPHAAGTLLLYHPTSRVLFAADLAEGGPWQEEREGLIANVLELGLDVFMVAPGHRAAMRWTEFVDQAAAQARIP